MGDNTHIQWTDATWNPITGCSVVSAGSDPAEWPADLNVMEFPK